MSCNWMCPSMLAGILCMAIPQASAHDLPAQLAACRAEKDDALRLACYDREVDSPDPHASGTAAAPTAAPQSPEERFGYRGVLAREESDRNKQETRILSELVAMVTNISQRGDGTLVMTLDNGQVWTQIRPDSFFRLKTGDQVKIEPAALGSFLMISPAKRTARVTRTR